LTQLPNPRAFQLRSLRDRLLAGALTGVISVALAAPALAAESSPAEAASAAGSPAAKPAKAHKQSVAKNSAAPKRKASATQQRAGKGAKGSAKPKANAAGPAYASRPEVMRFADDMAAQRNLDQAWVRRAIGQARHIPAVVKLMQPPTQPFVKNWTVYRSRFIDDARTAAGVKFWQSHAATLARAEKDRQLPSDRCADHTGL